GRAALAHLGDLAEEELERRGRLARAARGLGVEHAARLPALEVRDGAGAQDRAEARRAAAAEDGVREDGREGVGIPVRDAHPADRDLGLRLVGLVAEAG